MLHARASLTKDLLRDQAQSETEDYSVCPSEEGGLDVRGAAGRCCGPAPVNNGGQLRLVTGHALQSPATQLRIVNPPGSTLGSRTHAHRQAPRR